MARISQAVVLGRTDTDQLRAAGEQGLQILLLRRWHLQQQFVTLVAAVQRAGKLRQRPRIDAVGLGQIAHGLGKVMRLARVGHHHIQAGKMQRMRTPFLEAAGGLHEHQRYRQPLQLLQQRGNACCVVVKALRCSLVAQRYLQSGLGHVDTNKHGCRRFVCHCPTLQKFEIDASLQLSASSTSNCSGFMKTVGCPRYKLRDGMLCSPRQCRLWTTFRNRTLKSWFKKIQGKRSAQRRRREGVSGLKPNGRDGEVGTGRSPKARRRIAPTRPR